MVYSNQMMKTTIHGFSNDIRNYLDVGDDSKVVCLYLSLCSDSDDCIIGRFKDVDAVHIKRYVEDSAWYWYNILITRFTK